MTICNEDGRCQSEMLRDLIETLCVDLEGEDTLHLEEPEPPVIAHGKILDDYGNVIGTF